MGHGVPDPWQAADTAARSTLGLNTLIGAMGGTLSARLLATLATAPDSAAISLLAAGDPSRLQASQATDDDLAIIDRELARMFAARELYLAWVQEARASGEPGVSPAQFLRAWSDSTGRVIQLLRARRDLGGAARTDALLDAVYAELERRLPGGAVPGEAEAAPCGVPDAAGPAEREGLT